jgi:hypothetical protein
MERWVHYFTEVPAGALVDNKLLNDAFRVVGEGAGAGHRFEVATGLLVEILNSYPRSVL